MDYACPIKYNAEYRQVETEGKAASNTGSDTEDSAGILNWMTEFTATNWVSVYWVILYNIKWHSD